MARYREYIQKNAKRKRSRTGADRQTAFGSDPGREEKAQRQALRGEYFAKSLCVRNQINKAQKAQKEMI